MKNKKAFTLVEMIIVLAIIGVLAMIVIPKISGYISENKTTYNKKLINQLEVSGKNYYSENKNELPQKPYDRLGTIDDSYVALPTLQSTNYISKDFVDADGISCQESFVYVRQPSGTTENEYHPCLICGDKNYSYEYYEDSYCNLSNWNDNTNPSCSMITEESSNVVDENGTKTFYNPNRIKIQADDDGKIVYIIIRGYENGTNKQIFSRTLDVSKMTSEYINGMDLINYFKDQKGNVITARYEITVVDEGNNESICSNDRIVMDNVDPVCELKPVQNCETDKYIAFDKEKTKDNWSKQDKLQTLIDEKEGLEGRPNSIVENIDYTYSLEKKSDGTYYGYVKDEAGNVGTCLKPIEIEMCENDKPYCLLSSANNVYKYVKRDGKTTHSAECYLYNGEKGDYDLSKIQLKDKTLGTLDPKINSKKNQNKKHKIVIDIPFKVNNKGDGYENIIIKEGTVKSGSLTNDRLNVQEDDFYVDTTYPTVKWSTDQTRKYDSKTKTYYYKKGVKITATCTDNGSEMKSATISGKGKNITNETISTSKKSATITNNAKGKNLEYKVVCVDNAGNKKSYTKKYNVMEWSVDPSCPCKTYNKCDAESCDCKKIDRCKKAGCASWHYATGYSYKHVYSHSYCSNSQIEMGSETCTSSNHGQIKCRCSKSSSCPKNRKWLCTCWKCSRTSYSYADDCNYYNESLSKCGCLERYECEDKSCGCKTSEKCWHY